MPTQDPAKDTSPEEAAEAERHDRLYGKIELDSLGLVPWDWERFDAIRTPLDSYHASILRLGAIAGKRVLDYGCGDGWLTAIMAKRGAIVDGFDLSREAVIVARRRAAVNDVDGVTNFEVASCYALPVRDQTYDLVIGQAILHHVRDKHQVAEELYRILRPGGRAIFNEPLGNSELLERFRLLVPVTSEAPDDPKHWREQLKVEELTAFEQRFDVLKDEYHLLSRLDRVITWPPFCTFLGHLDRTILRYLPWFRRYARTIVVECRRPN